MAITVEQLVHSTAIIPLLKEQSATLLRSYRANPRLSSVFATQQRWLLAHLSLSLQFRAEARGEVLTLSRILEQVAEHELSSRNTADAFVKEMMHYGYIRRLESLSDRRVRPLAVSPLALDAISTWICIHLVTLDSFDGGSRAEQFSACENAISLIHPEIADGLMTNPIIRQPKSAFSLFTWLNNGGIIMDWLTMGLGEVYPDGQRYPTSVQSMSELASWLTLSHSHLGRKLREAEAMGSLGWIDRRGGSEMWVSTGFVSEIVETQATKLAVIDAAFERVFGVDLPVQRRVG